MTLQDRILQIDHIQARRFSKLTDDCIEIATEELSGIYVLVHGWMLIRMLSQFVKYR